MKEFIEKLIGRLEEKRSKYEELADGSNFDGWAQEEKIYLAKEEECENIIEIVNQLAEEYNNDFCEWKLEENTGIAWHCLDEKCSTYNNSYIQNLKIVLEDFECVCPYCGKKIKIAPYQPKGE